VTIYVLLNLYVLQIFMTEMYVPKQTRLTLWRWCQLILNTPNYGNTVEG